MGRSDYLVQAGVGFDVDRSGARKSLGVFESLAGMYQTAATEQAKKGFDETEKAYNDTISKIEKRDKKASKDFDEGVKKSARNTQEALHKARMVPPSDALDKKGKKIVGD